MGVELQGGLSWRFHGSEHYSDRSCCQRQGWNCNVFHKLCHRSRLGLMLGFVTIWCAWRVAWVVKSLTSALSCIATCWIALANRSCLSISDNNYYSSVVEGLRKRKSWIALHESCYSLSAFLHSNLRAVLGLLLLVLYRLYRFPWTSKSAQ